MKPSLSDISPTCSFRQISPFRLGSIRHFPSNVSDMWQQAAWHFENVLQVSRHSWPILNANLPIQYAIPVFEGLFPREHNAIIQTLFFRLAQWHALAKFQLHTKHSIKLLKQATQLRGQQLHKFKDYTYSSFRTMELPLESTARCRQKEGQAFNQNTQTTQQPQSRPLPKSFNLSTYNVHTLGHYPQTIWQFGTTDSYTTQIMSFTFSKGICESN